MKRYQRYLSMFLTIAMLAVLLAGCGGTNNTSNNATNTNSQTNNSQTGDAAADTSEDEKVIVYGLSSSWNRLMPYDLSAMNTVIPNDKVFDRLVYLTDDGIGMRAAKEIAVEDGGKTFVITLREDSTWHDGEPVTSEDWLWTFQTVSDPEFTGVSKSYLSGITGTDGTGSVVEGETLGVEAPDPYTLILHLKEANTPEGYFSPNNWYLPVMPKHLLEDVAPADLNDHEFWTHPIGSGPCKFVSEVPGTELVLEAYDDYYLGRPQFDKLIYKVVDSATAPTALLAGEIDTCFSYLAPDVALSLDGQNGLHADLMKGATKNSVLALNNELFSAEVRKAFSLAIDKQMLVDSLLAGEGKVTESYLLPTSKYANNDLPTGRDVERARQMLEDANFDFDRVYTVAASGSASQKGAAIIQQNLLEIGVQFEIVTGDSTALMSQARNGEVDALMLSFTTNSSPLYMMAHFSSESPNYSRINDPEYYEWQVKISSEQDEAKRIEIAKEAQEVYAEECPYIPLYQQNVYMVASEKLHNITVGNSDACWLWEVD